MTELPLSLSVVTNDGMCIKMLERGTEVPASVTRMFTAKKSLPSAVMAEIVRGERIRAADNSRVARVRLGGIKKSAGGIARISVQLDVADTGDIIVEMFDRGSHHRKRKIIKAEKWVPDEEAAKASVEEAEKHFEEDKRIEENCRLAGKARTAILITGSLKKQDRQMLSKEELDEIKMKARDLKTRIKAAPEDISSVDSKIIYEEIASVYKILEKLGPA